MNRKLTELSHKEQQLYFLLENKNLNLFSISDLRNLKLSFSKNYLNVILHRLAKKKYIYKIKKGLYLRIPASCILEGKLYLEDPFLIATKLFNGYLAFLSALRYYNLTDYQTFTIFIATKNKSKLISIGNYEFKAINIGKKFVGFRRLGNYKVSTLAKTFFDCFYKPEYAISYSEILKSLFNCKKIDFREFISYFKSFASHSLCQRTGYLLSLLNQETTYKVPKFVLEFFASKVKVKTKLLPISKKGIFIREWQLVDNIGKKELLNFWYYG